MYVTYNDLFTFVLMIVTIITLVKSFYDKHKNNRPCFGKVKAIIF